MIKQISNMIFLLLITSTAFAKSDANLLQMNVNLSDKNSLLRGAKIFNNYCLSCHSAAYMRYNRMGQDLGIDEDVLKTNFMFGTDKVGSLMTISMSDADAVSFFGIVPPDLSVTARSRGANWLYTYFKSFYIDESASLGVNNLVFKGVGMPHVLWQLQGMQSLVLDDTSSNDPHYYPSHKDLKLVTTGLQTEAEYDRTVRDLVNFMVYLSEPIQLKRGKIGFIVILYLLIFLVVAYLLKKEYWRDIH